MSDSQVPQEMIDSVFHTVLGRKLAESAIQLFSAILTVCGSKYELGSLEQQEERMKKLSQVTSQHHTQ